MFPFGFSFRAAFIRLITAAASLSITALFVACGGNGISPGLRGPASSIGINPAQPIPPQSAVAQLTQTTPSFNHVTIVMMENKDYDQIVGNSQAPYINSLARANALFTDSHAISHPSEPNYLALYSGSKQGVSSDECPLTFSAPSLGGRLLAAGKTIRGYMGELPSVGWTGCRYLNYWRKHDPLIDFKDTPSFAVVPYSQLSLDIASNTYPSVAFVVPNALNDMHDGTIARG